MKLTYKTLGLITYMLAFSFSFSYSQIRNELIIPDIPGYYSLKADLHMHTVFSDGSVWPTVRVDEAYMEGLDVISITDHIEYQPHKKDIPVNHNRPFDLALNKANQLGIILIKGLEITRSMPPGHFNALFIEDAEPADTEDFLQAIENCASQGAFIMWNHPGWLQKDEIPIWYDIHTTLYEKGYMHGMEIVNENAYYPLAYEWCLDKNITILGSSDIHPPIQQIFPYKEGKRRPLTIIFSKEKNIESIKEALFDGSTAVFYHNRLIGKEIFLENLFKNCIQIEENPLNTVKEKNRSIRLINTSDIPLNISKNPDCKINFNNHFTIPPQSSVMVNLSNFEAGAKEISMEIILNNFETKPGEHLKTQIIIKN